MRAASLIVLPLLLIAAPAGAVDWDKSGVDWSKPPEMAPDRPFSPPKPVRKKLKNGMSLLIIENHRLPLCSMQLVVRDAGATEDPAGKAGLAAFTADMLDEGAGDLSALALDAQLSQLGADLQVSAGDDVASIEIDTLARTLDQTLGVLALVLTAPRFDEAEATRVLADRITDLELLPDRPRMVAELLLRGVLYGFGGRYGRPTDGTLAEVKALTLADARAFHAARWTPDRMTLVVVGDVDPAALVLKLDELLGAWKPKGKKPAGAKLTVQKPKTLIYLVDRPGAEQADVRLGVVSITPKDKTAPAIDILGNALGGTFTSRLNRRLREELGWTYGARAGQRAWTGKSPFVISTALVTPHAVEGVAEILKIVATLVDGDLPADELSKAQQNLIRELPASFATNGGMVASFAALVRQGLPDDYYAGYAARVQKVTAKQVRAVSKTLLSKGKLVIVVIGDAALLLPGLEALGLGPVQLTSPDGKPL